MALVVRSANQVGEARDESCGLLHFTISGKYVLVDSNNDLCFELLRKPEHRTEVRDIIHQVTGKTYNLGRYSYPDEKKSDDPLIQLVSDMKAAGIPVEDKNQN